MPSEQGGSRGWGGQDRAWRDVASGGRAVAFNATFIIKQHERHKEATQTHASGTCTHTLTHTQAQAEAQAHLDPVEHTKAERK